MQSPNYFLGGGEGSESGEAEDSETRRAFFVTFSRFSMNTACIFVSLLIFTKPPLQLAAARKGKKGPANMLGSARERPTSGAATAFLLAASSELVAMGS